MSDTQRPGWWRASDEKWYPPESHPDYRPPAPPPPPPRSPSPPPTQRFDPQRKVDAATDGRAKQWWGKYRGLPVWAQVVLAVVVVGIIGAAASSGGDDEPTAAPTTAPSRTVATFAAPTSGLAATTRPPTTPAPVTTAPPTTQAGPKTNFAGDGTYRVGVDIASGTYRTAGPDSGRTLCYWERLSSLSGSFDAIIANENLRGQGLVTISASDVGFKSSGCQRWEKV